MAGEFVKEFNDENFATEVLASEVPVVVDLWAPWCGPCKMLGPIVEEVAKEYEGKVAFGKLNVDENPQTASKYGINSIPTIFFVKNGEVVDTQIGLIPKESLIAKIDTLL
jgi:thioredoxin 1